MQDELLTLKQAANIAGKTVSNISYLIQYKRVNKYDSKGQIVKITKPGQLRVSKNELLSYLEQERNLLKEHEKDLDTTQYLRELAFFDVPERERTKHVHRLHPYLGKFIPQLVEYFLTRNFRENSVILDPFAGSGTTLVQANELRMHSVGIDISDFNCMIARVKTQNYDLDLLGREVAEAYHRTATWSEAKVSKTSQTTLDLKNHPQKLEMQSEYLTEWFAPRTLQELLFFRSIIPNYANSETLMVILSRTARSCRLVPHYDLASARKPVTGPYYCYKHKRVCQPIGRAIGRLKYYSFDTIRRIKEFAALRSSNRIEILKGDSRSIHLEERVDSKWLRDHPISGIFTSPPYVGQIDYHEQHRYAYELLGLQRQDHLEIGPKSLGKNRTAREKYVEDISEVFKNLRRYMETNAKVFIVANDSLGLYKKIADKSDMMIVRSYQRPVLDRTERDKKPYSESIFEMRYNSS